jgi:hypothetical protein
VIAAVGCSAFVFLGENAMQRPYYLSFFLRLFFGFVIVVAATESSSQTELPQHHAQPTPAPVIHALPLSFEANVGQTDSRVKFLSRGSGYTLFLTASDAVLTLRRASAVNRGQDVVRLELVGANVASRFVGKNPMPGRTQYFSGNDARQPLLAPGFQRIRAANIYRGIDLVYYGRDQQLESDFVLAPGANPDDIVWRIVGAQSLRLDKNGDLLLNVASGQLVLRAPIVYQVHNGIRIARHGRYLLRGPDTVGFEIGSYDRSRELVIDPVLSYSTYLGSSGADSSNAIAVDASGNIYIAGQTASAVFPGAATTVFTETRTDGFLAKISPDGSSVLYTGYLAGDANTEIRALAVDPAGNAYVAGVTSAENFPTYNALQSVCSRNTSGACSGDAFVAKFDASGTPVYSTYFGGSGKDTANAVVVDSSGTVYVAGTTQSIDLPVTAALQWTTGGSGDAFMAKIASDGSHLIFATYLGGSGSDEANAIATDASGNVYLTGSTTSQDFPTRSPLQANCTLDAKGNCADAFVAKVSTDGSTLLYSTFLGGSSADSGSAIAVDANSDIYIAGDTLSLDFPLRKSLQGVSHGSYEVFLAKLAADGSSLIYSTYLGGAGDDHAHALAVDKAGNAFVAGGTRSPDFPLKDPIQSVCKQDSTGACSGDAFIASLGPKGSTLQFATYLGGTRADEARAVTTDAQGSIYITGTTTSSDFPSTGLSQTSNPLLRAQSSATSSGTGASSAGFLAKITGLTVANGTGSSGGVDPMGTSTNCTGTTTNWLGGAGNWSNASMWSTGIVPNGTATNVCIDAGNDAASQVTIDINVSVGTITVDANDTLIVGNGLTLLVAGNISNSGNILLNGSGSYSVLQIATGNNALLSGGGTVTMSNAGTNLINQQTSGGGSILTNVDNLIQGAGQIGWDGLVLVNQVGGRINANGTTPGIGILINAPAVTNAGLIEASGGGILLISPAGQVSGGGGSPVVNNAGGNIVSNGSGSKIYLSAVTIQGGTLNTLSGGLFANQAGGSTPVILDGTTHGTLNNTGTFTLVDNTITLLKGTISNIGTIRLNGAGAGLHLRVAASQNVTLTGGGIVSMNESGTNIISQEDPAYPSTLINVNNVIQGTGQIGWDGLRLVNQAAGIINANYTNTSVGIVINAPIVTNTGLVEATNGGILLVSPIGQVSGGGGNPIVNNQDGSIVSNGAGSQVLLSSASIQGGTLNTLNGGLLGTIAGGATGVILDGSTHGTLNNTGIFTAVDNTQTLLMGTINNTGTMQLNGAGAGLHLDVVTGQNVTLIGGGIISMNGSGTNVIAQQSSGGGSTLTNVDNIIQGTGQIGWDGLAIINQSAGTIRANFSSTTIGLWLNTPSVTNSGLIEATNGGLLVITPLGQVSGGNPVVNNSSGSIVSSGSGSQVLFSSATIQGGTLNTVGGGVLGTYTGSGDVYLDGSSHGALTNAGIYSAPDNTVTLLKGIINNTGTIQLNGASAGLHLRVATGQNVTLTGGGSVFMNSTGTNIISQQTSGGGSILTNFNNTIQGVGQIGWDGLAIVNQSGGTIRANFASTTVGILINARSITNAGLIEARDGGLLLFSSLGQVSGGAPIVNNAGGSIISNGSGSSVKFLDATIQGGSLNTLNGGFLGTLAGYAPTLDGTAHGALTNIGTYTLSDNSITIILGTINNSGTIQMNGLGSTSILEVASGLNATVTGTGSITMAGMGNNYIGEQSAGGSSTLTNGNGHTIQGNGQLGWNGLVAVNNGTILANSTNGMVVTASSFTNSGTVQTNGLCTLSVYAGTSPMNNAGNVIVNTDGTMVVFGTYTQTAGNTRVDGSLQADLLNINGGTLLGNGGIITGPTNVAGTLHPGDTISAAGLLSIRGAYTQTSAGVYNVAIGGLSQGLQFSQANITTTASLAGTLNASLITPFTPVAGNSFTILTAGALSGTFSSTNLPALTCGGAWQVSYTSTTATLNVVNPAPSIASLSPASKIAGDAAFTLTINGSGFVCDSSVTFNGNTRTTTFVSPTQITVAIPASDIALAGVYNVVVTNPAPGGGTSNTVTLTVNNPVPAITTLSPGSVMVGSGAFTLTINGTGFVSTSTVSFNGNTRTTTYVSSTQLTASIPASDVTTAGTYNVTVFNPTPGGGTSNVASFAVNNPVPTITTISPTSATAGGSGFTLTVNGTNFLASSTVRFNGNARTTTFVSATQLTATILASDIATGGAFDVTVTNPSPGGGTSNAATFTVNNPVPTITTISPTSATAGGVAFTLTVNGTGFVSSSTVRFNGNARTTTFVSATQLTASIPASDIATGGSYSVTVANPAPGGGTSNAVTFTVNNLGPTITTISPSSATAGGGAFTLTVNGTNFLSGSTVNFNGSARTTTFVSATQLTASIPASDIATAGTYSVSVTNPSPGGGTSNLLSFTVNNPVPTITTLSPNNATAGGAGFTLTVNGTNFVSTSTVNFNGSARTTTFVSATQLTASIPASDIATAGSYNVTVTNTSPGGGTSNPVAFTVNNPVPTVTTLSPNSATAGGVGFTLTVNGTNFISSSTVRFNGNARTTTYVSATQLTAVIPASDIATGGTFSVTVVNPAPGGGTSNPVTFTVNNPAPTITTISPANATVGGDAFTLTVNGTGFVSTSTVNFNGSARTTTFVSATQLTASIPASDIASAGSFNITVTTPSPGGGTSLPVIFVVASPNPVPTITSISPSSATAGGGSFTLTVNGTNFISSSTINFNGSAHATTYVSATQLTATIGAAEIATAGTYGVTVTNPAPGGGTSSAVTFTVNNPVPAVTTLLPSSATAGGASFTLTVNGTGFVSGSTVSFNGVVRTTTFVSATQLTAFILASDIATAGSYSVTVTNPSPGGGTSASVTFVVNAVNPIPTITNLSPSTVVAGGSAFTLTVNGTNFVSASTVNFNGSARSTTYINSTQLTAAIPASDIATAGAFSITVTNPTPGGGTSNAVLLTVNNPAPSITTLSPASATAGAASFTLTVNGTGFISSSTVNFNGNARTTTFVSNTQLTATILASDIAAAGNYNVTVTNPTPGGGTSAPVVFVVSAPNPVPTITTLSPSSAMVGGSAFTLTVNGTNFISASVVNFNGVVRTTTYISATQLTATILASDIASAGTYNVTVTNPAPGGGTSSAVTFTVNNPAPTISTLSPTSATAGGTGFSLTVNGSGFVATSTVNFNGTAKTTTYVSATRLTAVIQAADIATGGNFNVTVTNPSPGGGTSSALIFTVNNPVPVLSSIAPTTVIAGSPAFTVTATGTNFVSTSSITFDGTALATTIVSATQLTATVPASLVSSAKTSNLAVSNPAPGGGTSGTLTFTVTDFSFAAASGGSTTATVTAGQTATYNLQLTPANGFTGIVTMNCSGAPSLATCNVSPSSANVNGAAVTVTVTVTTTAPSVASLIRNMEPGTPMGRTNLAMSGMTMLVLLAGVRIPRKRLRLLIASGVAALALAFFVGCGGSAGGTNPPGGGTPKGTYTLTLSGSSGGVTKTTPLTLIVN